jgi:tyrosyl-tRNA synthetase
MPKRTSPYKFYQFWLNVADEEAERFIRIFTTMEQDEIEKLIAEHAGAPHQRSLQKRLAAEVTRRTHGRAASWTGRSRLQHHPVRYSGDEDALGTLSPISQWLDVFDGVYRRRNCRRELVRERDRHHRSAR